MNNRSLIIVLGFLGAALIGAFVAILVFYEGDKGIAIAGLVTVAGLIVPQLLGFKVSADNAVKLEKITEKVEVIAPKLDVALDTLDVNTQVTSNTHDLVNGQMTEFKQLQERFSKIEAELAGERGKAQGITEGRAQVAQEAPKPPEV